MTFNNVSKELLEYIQSKKFLAFPLPFANILIFACVIIRAVNLFIRMDPTITTIVFYLFFLSIVLLLAKGDFRSLAIGLGANAIIILLRMIINGFIGVPAIIDIIIYGFLAFIAFKKTPIKTDAPVIENAEVKKCSNCGSVVSENMAFCNDCGQKI